MNNQMMQMFMNRIMAKNPQAQQLYNNLRGKSTEELRQYAENVAQGRGINLRDFMSNYGIRI